MNVTSRILRLIFEHQPLSQSNLRDLSGFGMSTISSAVKSLTGHGIIQELGQRKERMGRPHTLLSINPGYAAVIGVQLNAERNSIVMTDFAGKLISEQPMPSGPITPAQVTNALVRFMRSSGQRKIAGIGLAIAGIIDADAGTCVRSNIIGWEDTPIAAIIREKTNLPVYVENDANALTLATLLFGNLPSVNSAVVANLGEGIGAGIIVDRRLYRGRSGNAGEIGHLKVTDQPTPVCRCGQTGCLESVASFKGISYFIAEATKDAARPPDLGQLDGDLLPEVAAVLSRAGHHLGRVLADLALIFDPDTIYLAMERHRASPFLVEETMRSYQKHRVVVTKRPTPRHLLTEWGQMWAIGAAGVAISKRIDDIELA